MTASGPRPSPAEREPADREPVNREPVNREMVVDAAMRIVEDDGPDALTMRRLSDQLGAAVTAVYWHVGNRDAVLDLVVARLLDEMGDVRPVGATPRSRVASVAHQLRADLLSRPHLVGLAHERGRIAAMFQPIQAALATELAQMGLRGKDAAVAVRALQVHVVASVVLQRTADRGPATDVTDPGAWPDAPDDPELVAALSDPLDADAVFDYGLEALLDTFPA